MHTSTLKKRQTALSQGRWLLVNVQGAHEFASHRLNRDTWAQPLVQEMVAGSFVLWQAYDSAPAGQAAARAYHLDALPAVLVVDPVTGECAVHSVCCALACALVCCAALFCPLCDCPSAACLAVALAP